MKDELSVWYNKLIIMCVYTHTHTHTHTDMKITGKRDKRQKNYTENKRTVQRSKKI